MFAINLCCDKSLQCANQKRVEEGGRELGSIYLFTCKMHFEGNIPAAYRAQGEGRLKWLRTGIHLKEKNVQYLSDRNDLLHAVTIALKANTTFAMEKRA